MANTCTAGCCVPANVSYVLFYEDAAQNIYGLVYDKDENLSNIVSGVGRFDPVPITAFEEGARHGFPYSPAWNPCCHENKSMTQMEAELKAQNHLIATVYNDHLKPSALYPANADPVGKQFLSRWIFG